MLYYLFNFILFLHSLSALAIQIQTANIEDAETINRYKDYIVDAKARDLNNNELHGDAKRLFIRDVFAWLQHFLPNDEPLNLSANLEKNSLYAKALLHRREELEYYGILNNENPLLLQSQTCQASFNMFFATAQQNLNQLNSQTKKLLHHSYIWWAQLSIKRTGNNFDEAWNYLSRVDTPPYTNVAKLWQAHLILINRYTPANVIPLNLDAPPHELQTRRLAEARRLLLELEPAPNAPQQQLIAVLNEAEQNQAAVNHAPIVQVPVVAANPVVVNVPIIPQARPVRQRKIVHPDFINNPNIKELKIQLQQELHDQQQILDNHLNNPGNLVELDEDDDNNNNDNNVQTIVFAHGLQPYANNITGKKRFKEEKTEQKFKKNKPNQDEYKESNLIKNIPKKNIITIDITGDEDTQKQSTPVSLIKNIPKEILKKYSGYKINNNETKKDDEKTEKFKLNPSTDTSNINNSIDQKNNTNNYYSVYDEPIHNLVQYVREINNMQSQFQHKKRL